MEDLINKATEVTKPVVEENKDVYETLLDSITNEHGERKYKTIDVALSSLKESQEYIRVLKENEANYKKQLEELQNISKESLSVKDLLDKIESLKQTKEEVKVVTDVTPNTNEEPTKSIDEIIAEKLAETFAKKEQENRFVSTSSKLVSMYGSEEEAIKAIKSVSEKHGMNAEQLKALAITSPSAYLALFDVKEKAPNTTSHIGSTVNTQGINSDGELKPVLLRGASEKDINAYVRQLKEKFMKEKGLK